MSEETKRETEKVTNRATKTEIQTRDLVVSEFPERDKNKEKALLPVRNKTRERQKEIGWGCPEWNASLNGTHRYGVQKKIFFCVFNFFFQIGTPTQ